VTAEKDAAAGQGFDGPDSILQAGTIAFRIAGPGWTVRPILTVGQIAAQHHEARLGKSLRQGNQQRSLAVRSRAVRKHKTSTIGICRTMEKAADEWIH
jgi:hypothetical protein